MWAVPWPINTGFDEGSRYNTLLQISVGQEEIDEVRCCVPASCCAVDALQVMLRLRRMSMCPAVKRRVCAVQVISRDIHRTFPEHPQFGFQQGQQALFRVLKAYSLHDLEVRRRRRRARGCACAVCMGGRLCCAVNGCCAALHGAVQAQGPWGS